MVLVILLNRGNHFVAFHLGRVPLWSDFQFLRLTTFFIPPLYSTLLYKKVENDRQRLEKRISETRTTRPRFITHRHAHTYTIIKSLLSPAMKIFGSRRLTRRSRASSIYTSLFLREPLARDLYFPRPEKSCRATPMISGCYTIRV